MKPLPENTKVIINEITCGCEACKNSVGKPVIVKRRKFFDDLSKSFDIFDAVTGDHINTISVHEYVKWKYFSKRASKIEEYHNV